MEIRYASEPAPVRERKPFPSGGSPRGGNSSENTVFVGGLSYNSTEQSVQEFFAACGNIQAVRIAKDQEGNPRGFAHVEFDAPEAVQTAIGLSGQNLDGRNIRVDTAGSKGEKPQGRFGGDQQRGPPRGGFRGRGAPRGRGGPAGGIDAAKKKGTMQGFAGKKVKLE